MNELSEGLVTGLAILMISGFLFVFAWCWNKMSDIENEEENKIFKGSLVNAVRAAIGITIPGISAESFILVDESNDLFGDRITAIRNDKENPEGNFSVIFWHETKKDAVKITKVLAEGDDDIGYEIQRVFEYRHALKRGIFGK